MNQPHSFEAAVYHAHQGQFAEAQQICRAILADQPNHANACHLLGVIAHQTGRTQEAIESLRKAIALEPGNANWHFALAEALAAASNNAEAFAALENCLRINPDHLPALNSMANLLCELGQFPQAEEKLRRALQLKPNLPPAMFSLARVLAATNRLDEAAALLHRLIAIDPRTPVYYRGLGNVLGLQKKFSEAADAYRRALALQPNWPDVHNDLSTALREAGDFDGAIAAAQQSLRLHPDFPPALKNLAGALRSKGLPDDAIDLYQKFIDRNPSDDAALKIHANMLFEVGRAKEAIADFRRAAEINASNIHAASNYLFALQFDPEVDAMTILHEHRRWNERYAVPLQKEARPFNHDRSPDRRLRIGYLSNDFRRCVSALFTMALLPFHDHEQFEIYCYSASPDFDAITARHKSHANAWRSVASLSDEQLADQIRADRIDILMDLIMHTTGPRLLALARKPAPVQAIWLPYPGTTGLSTMDFRLSDPYLDPPEFENRYTEKTIRLPDNFWCYDPHGMSLVGVEFHPEPGPLPATQNNFVTFGSLNGFFKLNPPTIERWGRLMQAVPKSRLHLLAPIGQCRQRVLTQLHAMGIESSRIEFVPFLPRASYLAEYRRIDLCVDPLPYNGHTTSMDAFWMGVPVLTRLGHTLVGRAGLGLLENLKLPNFAANNDDEFVSLGARWAADISGLAEIRRTLPDRMASCPLMDAKRYTRNFESALRQMWHHWTK